MQRLDNLLAFTVGFPVFLFTETVKAAPAIILWIMIFMLYTLVKKVAG